MNDQARNRLGELLKAYGPTVCNTPRTCEIVLNQYVGDFPQEARVLATALQKGSVTKIMKSKPGQQWDALSEPLVKELSDDGSLSHEEAVWTIESWGRALGKHPEGIIHAPEPTITAMSEPERPPLDMETTAKATTNTMLVGVGGALGGGLGAGLATLAIALLGSAAVDAFARGHPQGSQVSQQMNMMFAVLVVVFTVVGLIGGGLGGVAGWVLGQGGSGRPYGAMWGAFGSAFVAGALGGRMLGLIGAFFGPALASFGAALTGAYRK